MKSLMLLWSILLQDLGEWCCTSTSLDLKKAQVRFEHEGVSFLTITLPQFCKDFEKSLDQGCVSRDLFTSFKWRGGLPLFLGGFLDRVFDRGTGMLLSCPDVDSIFAVRQLTLFCGKILLPCTNARERDAINGFLNVEERLKDDARSLQKERVANDIRRVCQSRPPIRRVNGSTPVSREENLTRMGNLLFRDVFTKLDHVAYDSAWLGRHGPGATADRIRGNQKWSQRVWTDRLEQWFPFGEHALGQYREQQRLEFWNSNQVTFLEPGEELPVRVTLVPKTLKTPRIIAIEPTCMQYMQQAVLERLAEELKGDSILKHMIGLDDQIPNQEMARRGSLFGDLATLDLSEASDRVSNQHVRALLRRFPNLSGAIDACRSRKADVPGHGVIRLAKFASMGSALTFPMEAMIFLSLIFLGIEKELNIQLTRKDVESFVGQVRVYGDDIIVPVRFVPSVVSVLSDFGHKVNTGKSFWNGKFRESCGKEFYDGCDVSISRVRRPLPVQRTDVPEIISAVSLRNQLYYAGLWRTTRHLDEILTRILGESNYPVLELDGSSVAFTGKPGNGSPLLGRQSVFRSDAVGFCRELHHPLTRGYVVKARPPLSHLEGDGALLKWFLKRGEQPFADRDHLERQGRPQSVNIKLRYARPY